ncbi:MAG: HAD hydrolase family protein [Caldisericaceae bacterium]|nr:HAD hydrolase family protein [Caldisericaceae bacterium]
MIEIEIPGFKKLQLKYLVMDYNGTLAIDGKLIEGVENRLYALADHLEIHVITADTFGLVKTYLENFPIQLKIITSTEQGKQKWQYVRQLGSGQVVAIGNGRNDRLMLKEAKLGIATIQAEGAAMETIQSADIVVNHINDALDLLREKLRLTATLRD